MTMKTIKIIEVTPDNISSTGIYCIKDQNTIGYHAKANWYKAGYSNGLRIKIAQNEAGEQLGFIEYVPAEFAWRPIKAPNYLFIHCIMVYPNKYKQQGVASLLVEKCKEEAQKLNKSGVVITTSKGTWMAKDDLFIKNGFIIANQSGRFNVLVYKIQPDAPDPTFINWQTQQAKYQGWHLIYANQCPWHTKSVEALQETAMHHGIHLEVTELKTAQAAQEAPSGYGVFSLLHDGKLLEDHYISSTRFENILQKELRQTAI